MSVRKMADLQASESSVDLFLQHLGLYRKHMLPDADSIFRIVAEQMYDSQVLYYEVRQECVRFMTRKRHLFEHHITGDFDSYVLEMSRTKTAGTTLELYAMCLLYKRNAKIFKSLQLGFELKVSANFRHKFRVYQLNKHFDAVYHMSEIYKAGICQAISFKLIYKGAFKLPDLEFAVESMLHPKTFEDAEYCSVSHTNGDFSTRVVCKNGRIFHFDKPHHTCCILPDSKLCGFHNNMQLQPVCPELLQSCVRQVLESRQTPFSFKVAESLDARTYRNMEFDCWTELRKVAKSTDAYDGSYNFVVGARCLVELLNGFGNQIFTCYIQSLSADLRYANVHIVEMAKIVKVPYKHLHPLPPNQFSPWTMPSRAATAKRQTKKKTNKPKQQSPKLLNPMTSACYSQQSPQQPVTSPCYPQTLLMQQNLQCSQTQLSMTAPCYQQELFMQQSLQWSHTEQSMTAANYPQPMFMQQCPQWSHPQQPMTPPHFPTPQSMNVTFQSSHVQATTLHSTPLENVPSMQPADAAQLETISNIQFQEFLIRMDKLLES